MYVCIYIIFFNRSGSSGDSDKEKWILYGLSGALALVSVLAYYNMSYKEITWKDFINKYVF